VLDTNNVGLLESTALDVAGFSKTGRGARGDLSVSCGIETGDEASDRLRFGLLAQSILTAEEADEQKQKCPGHPKHKSRVPNPLNADQLFYSVAGSVRLSVKW